MTHHPTIANILDLWNAELAPVFSPKVIAALAAASGLLLL